jgi:hypothetical protein
MFEVAYYMYKNEGFRWEDTPLQLLGGVLCGISDMMKHVTVVTYFPLFEYFLHMSGT